MTARGLRFRTGTPQDTAAVVALLNGTFRTPIDAETWEWYACGNPNGPSRIYLALEPQRETMVGVVGFSPIFLRLEGAAVQADYAHHLALQPEYRDTLSYLGIMQFALKAEASRGVKIAIGPPNRTAYPIQKKLTKWVDFGFLERLRKLAPVSQEHACREVALFSADFDRFYDSVSRGLAFCLEKNAAWMNWRFCRRPGSPYTVYATGTEDKLAGYVILKRWQDENGYRKAHIMDLHAAGDAALQDLLAAAESYAAGGGCAELNLWAVQGYPYRHFLESRGFAASSADRQPLIARPFDGFPATFPEGYCSLSYGDGDSQY